MGGNIVMRIEWILLILIGVIVLYSSGLAWTWGSGRIASEVRTVPAFDSIDLRGSGHVHLKEGSEQFLKVETDDNLLKRLETKVVFGCLRIGFRPGTIHGTRCEIYITMPRCKNLFVSGSGSIESEGMVHSDNVSLNISGSGNAVLDVETHKLDVVISGSGNANLIGKADELNAVISGSGNLGAFGFEHKRRI